MSISEARDPATSGIKDRLARVATMLVEQGVLSDADRQEVVNHGSMTAARIQAGRVDRSAPSPFEVIAQMGFDRPDDQGAVTESMALEAVARSMELGFERLDPLKMDPEFVTGMFGRPFAQRHQMVPVRDEGERLVIAIADPFDDEGREVAKKTAGKPLQFVVSPRDEVMRVIREFYGFRTSMRGAQEQISGPKVDVQNLEQLIQIRGDKELEASDQHIINAVDYVFRYAFETNASDIHIEPRGDESIVRFRIDGVLHRVYSVPKKIHAALVSRIKLIARMDIAEKRRPQDGRIKTVNEGRQVEMRVSAMPVAMGEKIVIRLFDPGTIHGDLEKLGFRDDELGLFRRWISQPHGVVLVTGPTGSGKSTTLYTALMNVATDEINVVTVEDPIEMMFDHLNQVAVQSQVGVTFSSALRTILRQDPDVIMIGEIRDQETARHAIQASLTGHMVYSTLHTNDALTAVPRMVDLGVEPYLLASALTGCMAQRLVRRVCDSCKVEKLIPVEEIVAAGGQAANGDDVISVVEGEGCVDCRGTGYRGRVAVVEMADIDEDLRQAIAHNESIDTLRQVARGNGMRSLRRAGLDLVRDGLTTIEEVLRVTADASE